MKYRVGLTIEGYIEVDANSEEKARLNALDSVIVVEDEITEITEE